MSSASQLFTDLFHAKWFGYALAAIIIFVAAKYGRNNDSASSDGNTGGFFGFFDSAGDGGGDGGD